jgi:3-methyladenine DNA glycosylase AlkD
MSRPLVAALRRELRARGDADRARAQQAYMKSEMPYYGLKLPELRAVCKHVFAAHPLQGFEQWRDASLALWRGARFREERYAAIELTGHRLYRAHQTLDALPLYEEMITSGGAARGWDFVDDVASHRVGPLLRAYPREMKKTLLAWARGDDMWKRRAAIIAQVSFKEATDTALLYACIRPSLGRKEPWLRKAIGWALREHAWHDPREIARYVREHEGRLSPLSKREALKHLASPAPRT